MEDFGQRTIREDYSREWDLSVVEAVKREAEILGIEDWSSHFRECINLVSGQSEPFLTISDYKAAGQPVKFWTINPEIRKHIGAEKLYQELFTFRDGDRPVEEPEFFQIPPILREFPIKS